MAHRRSSSLPAGETPAVQRAREENGRDHRQQRREKRLPEGERQDMVQR